MQPPPRREAGRMTVWSLRPLQVNVGHAAGQKGHVNCTVRDLQRVGRKCIAAPDIPLSSAPGKDALWAACLPVSPVSNAQAPANQTSLQIIGWDGGVTPARWLPWSGDRVSPPGPSATKMDRATRALGSSAYISLSVALNRAPERHLRSSAPVVNPELPSPSSAFFVYVLSHDTDDRRSGRVADSPLFVNTLASRCTHVLYESCHQIRLKWRVVMDCRPQDHRELRRHPTYSHTKLACPKRSQPRH